MIAREGIPFIGIGLILTLVAIYAALRWDSVWLLSVASLTAVLSLFCLYFFRDPQRHVPGDSLAVVSPGDGRVVQIRPRTEHPFIGGDAVQVSIFLSVFDVHINRIPVSGKIEYVKYNSGKFLAAFNDKASLENEQTEIGLLTDSGDRIVFKQIAGIIARRIVCRLHEGDTVRVGERFGMIRFGSRVDLIVPAVWHVEVALGDRVKGGETVLARMPDPKETTERVTEMTENGH